MRLHNAKAIKDVGIQCHFEAAANKSDGCDCQRHARQRWIVQGEMVWLPGNHISDLSAAFTGNAQPGNLAASANIGSSCNAALLDIFCSGKDSSGFWWSGQNDPGRSQRHVCRFIYKQSMRCVIVKAVFFLPVRVAGWGFVALVFNAEHLISQAVCLFAQFRCIGMNNIKGAVEEIEGKFGAGFCCKC
jgi:hypothetical protein